MQLETNRLILRPWSEDEAEELYNIAKDPRVGPAAGWKPHSNVKESRNIIRDVLIAPENYAVLLKESSTVIGSVGLRLPKESALNLQKDEAELGIWLGVEYWSRGYAREASAELTRHGFEELGLTRVYATCFLENTRSAHMQEKLGFRYRKTLRNHYCAGLDEYKDLELRVLINPMLEL